MHYGNRTYQLTSCEIKEMTREDYYGLDNSEGEKKCIHHASIWKQGGQVKS